MNELESVRTIVDVGANRGEKIRHFNKFFPGVYINAFEPLIQHKEHLDDLQNKMNCLRVHNFALGTEECSVNMNQNAYGPSSSILGMLQRHKEIWPKTEESSIIEVEMKTLDQIYQQEKFENPAVLKIDVQGYELQCLKVLKIS